MKTVINGDRLMCYDDACWTYLRIATEEDRRLFSDISEFRDIGRLQRAQIRIKLIKERVRKERLRKERVRKERVRKERVRKERVRKEHVYKKYTRREYYLAHREASILSARKWQIANRERVTEHKCEYNTRRSFKDLQAPEEFIQTVVLRNRLCREIRKRK